ncbi:hypothetical protein QYF61_009109 [Mycteria americana]|uniref:Uncharacterized protein n=1 Tax=Mycteria americana TaxID=33587 RepID=A0AAN7S4N9_MYCAM|nr:hypothetical protein QYF61_009109 [Mycteria americana]
MLAMVRALKEIVLRALGAGSALRHEEGERLVRAGAVGASKKRWPMRRQWQMEAGGGGDKVAAAIHRREVAFKGEWPLVGLLPLLLIHVVTSNTASRDRESIKCDCVGQKHLCQQAGQSGDEDFKEGTTGEADGNPQLSEEVVGTSGSLQKKRERREETVHLTVRLPLKGSGEIGCQENHDVQQKQMQSPAPGEEWPHALG